MEDELFDVVMRNIRINEFHYEILRNKLTAFDYSLGICIESFSSGPGAIVYISHIVCGTWSDIYGFVLRDEEVMCVLHSYSRSDMELLRNANNIVFFPDSMIFKKFKWIFETELI